MIVTELYRGQGLGNQLWSYAVCRSAAEMLGVTFGIQSYRRFKGSRFMELSFGEEVRGRSHKSPSEELPYGVTSYFRERKILHPNGYVEITPEDPRLFEIEDGTKIDGYFQSENYILPIRDKICDWFDSKIKLEVSPHTCVINFRGGEYRNISEVLLKREFYERAITRMLESEELVEFVVVTDDAKLARQYFGSLPIVSKARLPYMKRLRISPTGGAIGNDFTWLQRANYLILSNSSFSWWGAWTNQNTPKVIAPKYWARHNTSDGYWALGDSLTRNWNWLDRNGAIFSYAECKVEKEEYESAQSWTRY